MAFAEKQLCAGTQLGTSVATLYTVPASTVGILKHITVSNANASARTLYVYIIPNGGSAGDDNALINTLSIPGNAVMTWDGFIPMETAGDFIQAKASAVSSLTIIIGGAQVT